MNFKKMISKLGRPSCLLALAITLTMIGGKADACSIYINQKAKKNALTMEFMNSLGITIDQVIAGNVVQNYQMQILSENPATLCPNDIQFSAKITLNYKPTKFKVCKNIMTVTMVEHWGTPGAEPTVNFSTVDPEECHNLINIPRLPLIPPHL